MKYLFLHQNFPGQFVHLVRHLVARGEEVVFITEPNANQMAGVRKIPYRRPDPPGDLTHWTMRESEMALRRAEAVAATAHGLRQLGFEPDIIIGHHGWGEMLNLGDVWPGAPMLGYFEFYYHTEGIDVNFDPEFPTPSADYPRIRAKNTVNLLALTNGGVGQTPTEWQLSTYPEWARPKISLLREGVDLELCRPDPAVRRTLLKVDDKFTVRPKEKLVTYVSRDLEPYRGCHVMMRALPALLARKDVKVVMVGGDGVSYGSAPPGTTWKARFLREVEERLDDPADLDRVLFPGKVRYEVYRKLLQRSDAHVYLTYPFVASWSLREALAMGCVVVGSDTPPVREFVRDGETGRLVSFFDPDGLARTVLEVLERPETFRPLRVAARRWAERHLDMDGYIAEYEALIARTMGRG